MFGWSKRKQHAPLQPEARWVVAHDTIAIHVTDAENQTRSVEKAALSGIAIETNDTGPWGADLWWLLFGEENQLSCAFPQGATGEAALLDYMLELPGFDHREMIRAQGSTDTAVFPVWRRPAA